MVYGSGDSICMSLKSRHHVITLPLCISHDARWKMGVSKTQGPDIDTGHQIVGLLVVRTATRRPQSIEAARYSQDLLVAKRLRVTSGPMYIPYKATWSLWEGCKALTLLKTVIKLRIRTYGLIACPGLQRFQTYNHAVVGLSGS